MGKKKLKRYFKEILLNPYTGKIPSNTLPPASQVSRCLTLIKDARDYLPKFIRTTEEIDRCWMPISKHSTLHIQQPKAWYKTDSGSLEPQNELDTVDEGLLLYIAQSTCGNFRNFSISELFAVLSIKEAQFALKEIINENALENNRDTILRVQKAAALLSKAEQPLIKHGKRFKQGCRGARKDILQEILEKTYLSLYKTKKQKPSFKEVIKAFPINKYIQEVDSEAEKIYWQNGHGKEKTTTFKALSNRLTKIKKSHTS